MRKTCMYQRLNYDLEWECPKDEVCAKRCEKGKMGEESQMSEEEMWEGFARAVKKMKPRKKVENEKA